VPEWSGAKPVVASVASFGSLNLIQGRMARAVSPVAATPVSGDRPQSSSQHTASAVALAPAAMAALIEAQENETQDAAPLARLRTVHVLDQLLGTLDGAQTTLGAPASPARLETARAQLLETAIAA
jgi:hypothetical protein